MGSSETKDQMIETRPFKPWVFPGGHSHASSPQGISGGHRAVTGPHGCQERELMVLQPWKPQQILWPSHKVTEAAGATGSRTVTGTHTHLIMQVWARDEDNIS